MTILQAESQRKYEVLLNCTEIPQKAAAKQVETLEKAFAINNKKLQIIIDISTEI